MAPLFISTTENSYGRAMMAVVPNASSRISEADGVVPRCRSALASYGARAYRAPWDGCNGGH